MIRVTRRYRFSASHRLHCDRFSETQNRELYGKCNNPYGHGHDYLLDVTVSGPVDPASGQTVRIALLDRLVRHNVVDDFEHRNLNEDVGEFSHAIPTSENIISVIESRLKSGWRSEFPGEWPRLESIRLQETRKNRFELRS